MEHRTIIADGSTEQRVRKIIIEHFGARPDEVQPDVLLVPEHDDQARKVESDRADLGCDSLDVVELVMAFEEEFDIAIPDDEAEPLNRGTVQDCIDLVTRKLAE